MPQVTLYPLQAGGQQRKPKHRISVVHESGRREDTAELAALAECAMHFEPRIVAIENVFDDRQAETGATTLSRSPGVDAIEAFGKARQVFCRDAFAIVADRHHTDAILLTPAEEDAAAG